MRAMTTRKPDVFWDKDQLRNLIFCKSTQLREMALALSEDPVTFYRSADFRGVDLRGQDLRGLDLSQARLKGAIVDVTTLIDSRLTNLFGFPTEDELLSTFDEESLPLFGRGGILIEILSNMAEGRELVVIGGLPGSGKTAVITEIQKILTFGISPNVYLPGGIRRVAQDGTSIPLPLKRQTGQVLDGILFALARYPEGESRDRLLSPLLQDDLFDSSFEVQLSLFGRSVDIFEQVLRKGTEDEKRRFLTAYLKELGRRFPKTRIVLIMDDVEAYGRKGQSVTGLVKAANNLQLVVGTRHRESVDLVFRLGKNSRISRTDYLLETPSPDAMSQIFDWLESRTAGAVIFPAKEREDTLALLGSHPRVLLAALRSAVAFALLEGDPVPIKYSQKLLLRSGEEIVGLLGLRGIVRLRRLSGTSEAVDLARLESILNSEFGASDNVLANLFRIDSGTARDALKRLAKMGAVEARGGRYFGKGSLVWRVRPTVLSTRRR